MMSLRYPRRAFLSDVAPCASAKNPSSPSTTNSSSAAPARRLTPGTPVGATRSSSRYNVLSIPSTACAPVTEHQASANAIAVDCVPRIPGSAAHAVDTSTAAVFAMAAGNPLTRRASPDTCSAAPTAPSQSATDRKTPSAILLVARRTVSSLVNNTGSRRYTQWATGPKSVAVS
jgi:hypothetical protein